MALQESRSSMRARPRRMALRHMRGNNLGDHFLRVWLEPDLQFLIRVPPRDDHEQPAGVARVRDVLLELASRRLDQRLAIQRDQPVSRLESLSRDRKSTR